MAKYDYNLIVIGGGSAGLVAAMVGSTARAKTMLIERDKMGGDCLNTGCVPSKTLIASAKIAHSSRTSEHFGVKTQGVSIDFTQVMNRVHQAIKTIEPHDSVERYTALGVDCRTGHAVLDDPHTIMVDGKSHSSRSIVLATGAEPQLPNIEGINDHDPLTTENLWNLTELPQRLVILGGGPVGCELAQSFARLGSSVTIVEASERLLRFVDGDAAEFLSQTMTQEGIQIFTSSQALKCESNQLFIQQSNGVSAIDFDRILVATGRVPRSSGFGLSENGIGIGSNGSIAVNRYLQTSQKSVFACGDVVGPHQFTHMAAHQAWYASMNALARPFWRFPVASDVVPFVIFTDPEIAQVGLSESDAHTKGIAHQVTVIPFNELDRAITDGRTQGYIKLITKPKQDKLLGACIVCANAGELILSCVNAMTHHYGTNKILSTIHPYPTKMEGVRYAAGKLRRENTSKWVFDVMHGINGLLR